MTRATDLTPMTAVLTEIPSDLFNRLLRLSLQTGQGIETYVMEALEKHITMLERQHLNGQELSLISLHCTPTYTLDDMERDLEQAVDVADHSGTEHDDLAGDVNGTCVDAHNVGIVAR